MNLIKLLAVYISFEEFFLKWLPVDDFAYLLLRQMPDAIVFTFTFVLMLAKISSSKKINIIGNKADVCLFVFVIWAFATLIFNPSADIMIGLANIKALLRYILLIYIVMMLNPSQKDVDSLVRWILIAVVCQALIGVYQFIGGIDARDFLVARKANETLDKFSKEFTGDRFEGVNDLMGTMGDTISFGYFMMIGMVLWFFSFRINSWKYWCGITSFLLLIYLSGSRAITLVAPILIVWHSVLVKGWDRVTKIILLLAFLIVPFSIFSLESGYFYDFSDSNRNSFWFMFSSDYLEIALNQRLGLIVYLVPNLLFEPQTIVGFGPDRFYVADFVAAQFPMVPSILLTVLPFLLEDVYWVALYAYYGMIGLTFFLAFLYILQKKLRKSAVFAASHEYNRLNYIALFFIFSAVPLNFLNQAFEARSFSFYLWLFCGLALVDINRKRKREVLMTSL